MCIITHLKNFRGGEKINILKHESEQIFQNICPRNCYCSCGLKTKVKNNKIIDIEGDGNHPFSQGKLCAKGYTFLNQVYHPERVLYPMLQVKRGTNKWKRISWEKALNLIAEKIVNIIDKYESTLPIFFDKQSGNIGVISKSLELFFNSLGSVSKFGNNLCNAAGKDAHLYTFGSVHNSDPEDMVYSRYIIIWGGNPAWTCFQQMKIINAAQDKGAKVVVIDPVQTATSVSADKYIKIKPGTDGALALGMAKYIIDNSLFDLDFINNYVQGWQQFKEYVLNKISLAWVAEVTGVNSQEIVNLAKNYAVIKPAVIWQGFGAQRYENGGQNYRIINTLAAITGNIGYKGAGIYYDDIRTICKLQDTLHKTVGKVNQHRDVDISSLTSQESPPIKMAFITTSNPLAQYPDTTNVRRFLQELDLVVTVDQFLTKTAIYSDLFLPTTSFLEKPDIIASYWHKYIGYNQQAISPLGESKSELEIANLLANYLNKLFPGIVNFKTNLNGDEFLEKNFAVLIKKLKV